MPLYDFRCQHCAGIFERLIPIAALRQPVACTYCGRETAADPMPTAAPAVRVAQTWRPANGRQQLAGREVAGPGTEARAQRSNVLHVCKGSNCSICGT
jgi:putative FmdB family regulatory protein